MGQYWLDPANFPDILEVMDDYASDTEKEGDLSISQISFCPNSYVNEEYTQDLLEIAGITDIEPMSEWADLSHLLAAQAEFGMNNEGTPGAVHSPFKFEAPAAAPAGPDSADPIKLPIHNWSSQIAGVYAVGAILESTGNSVEYISADSTVVYTSMCEGDMDLVHEVWQGAFGVAFEEQVDAGCVIDAATHDAKTREEWWYPSYIEDVCPGLPDWEALNGCAEMFATPDSGGKGRFLGGPVDWLKGDQERVEGLGMDFIVENAGTAGALWSALEAASANNEPIVLFNWTPNFIEAMYDGQFIEFPTFADECRTDASWGIHPETTHDCGNPKDGYLKLGVWSGFPDKWPTAYAAVQNMNFTNLDVAQLAMYVDIDGMEPEDAAALWLANNCARWTGWSGADASVCPEAPEAPVLGLAAVCPSPIVIQTDWFPEAEHGAMYEMIGDGYSIDAENMVVSGPAQSGGVLLGIDIEVRTGGPAIGWAPVSSHVYTDESIHLGYRSTDQQILQHADAPMISVVAPLEKNPQMIMWDPETYPDVRTLADLGEQGITINIFGGGTFSHVFAAEGIWSEDQIDPSYDGSPAVFVASGGEVAQQGFASAEPYQYEQVYEEWGKPVAFQLLNDAGFVNYSQTLAIRSADLESLRPCLELFVPVVQQAVIDYDASPERANAIIVDAVVTFDSFWSYDMDLAAFSHATQRDLGLIGNGPDSTVGNMEPSRIQTLIDKIAAVGLAPDGLTVDDLMTNEFIDMSIGFPAGAG